MADNTPATPTTNKRKEKFQTILAYFERFTQDPLFRGSRTPSSTPKKAKKVKTPKSKSKKVKKSNKNTPSKQSDKENIDENAPQTPIHNPLLTPDVKSTNSPAYDSDTSYKLHAQKKRRQSFNSVRVSRKAPRRMTLAGNEISPVLLNRTTHQARPLSWTRGSTTPTPIQIKRSLCAGEILQTEENFVSRLELLKKLYIIPLQTDRVLTNEESNSIFSNVELILSLNRALLTDLQELMHDWEDSKIVGTIFVKIIPFLKIYTEYVNNHEAALGVIETLLAKNMDFRNFVERTQKDKQCNGLLLRDFLIDPVQRIPRYELLLKELLKNTPEDHPDHAPLETALEQVRNVATVLNEKHREQKSRVRVLEIKKLFGAEFPDLVMPHRILIEEGNVLLMPSKQPVTIYLFNDIVVLAESTGDKKMRPTENRDLETVWVVSHYTVNNDQPDSASYGYSFAPDCLDPEIGEVVSQEFVFELLWPGTKFAFLCTTSEECEKWSNAISGAINDKLQKQPRTATARGNYRLYRDSGGVWEVTAPPVAARITKEQYEAEATTYTQQAIQDLINANALAIRSISERKKRRKSGIHSVLQRLTPHKSSKVTFSGTGTPTRTPNPSPPSSPYSTPIFSATPTRIANENDENTPSSSTTPKKFTPKAARYSVATPLNPKNYLADPEPSPRPLKKPAMVMHTDENSPPVHNSSPTLRRHHSPKGTLRRNSPSPTPRRRRRSSTGTPNLRPLKSALSPTTPRSSLNTSPRGKTPKKVLFADASP